MACPDKYLAQATKYLQIYLMGMPIVMLYNFLASILRAVGDTLRPMIFLTISGVLNVGLNFLFVSGFGMSVEGVAYATVISQAVSASCCLLVVLRSKGYSKFSFKYFRIYKRELIEIFKIGIPGGIQGCLFSLSNVFLQSAVNNLDIVNPGTLAANTASTQFDAIVYFIGNAVATACMSFVSQNYGAGNMDRVKKVIKISILAATIGSFGIGLCVALLSRYLLRIMTDDATVIAIGQIRLGLLGLTYFLCGILEVLSLSMRALGKSTISMVICLIGACGFRILWINTIYLLNPSYFMIYLCYPITWVLTIGALIGFLIPQIKKIERKIKAVNKKGKQ
jgi:putative MATE family efflux protein